MNFVGDQTLRIFTIVVSSALLFSCSKENIQHREINLDEVTTEKAQEEPEKPQKDPLTKAAEVVITFQSRIKHGAADAEHNVRLAANKISGTILKPGEVFSFNGIVGERTEESGFKEAPILFGGVIQDGIGGGVCQVSASLYLAAMRTGMKVIERHPHSRPASYTEKGMDSAINWPHIDLKFENNTSDDVVITIDVFNGFINTHFVFYADPVANPDSVKTFWVSGAPIPFRTDYIKSKYVKKEQIAQKGEISYPGFRVWDYGKEKRRVFSMYKPIPRVVIVPEEETTVEETTEIKPTQM